MKEDNLPKGVYKETDRRYKRYTVAWSENGKLKRKTFSIHKYGDELACKLACDFRTEKEIELQLFTHENIYIDMGSYYILKIKNPNYEEDVLFDFCDFDKISNYSWYINNTRGIKSVNANINNSSKDIRYAIFGENYYNNVVYKNKNNLDNRRSNLIVLTSNVADRVSRRQINPRNTSGKTGVYKRSYAYTKNKQERIYEYWTAHCSVNNKNHTKSFSVNKYGDDEAFRLACEARDMLAEKYENYNA